MKRRTIPISFLVLLLTLLCVLPYFYVGFKSLVGSDGPTLFGYYSVFLAEAQYLTRFWTSLGLTVLIAAAQLLVSTLA